MRWELYCQIKKKTQHRNTAIDEYYMTKNELRCIMNQLDLFNLREQVFKLYRVSVPKPNIDPPHEILMRAHYTYMEDPIFEKDIQQLRKDHE